MKLISLAITLLIIVSTYTSAAADGTWIVENPYYTSVMDCRSRTPLMVIYKLSKDTGTAKRYPDYIDDAELKEKAPHCHPTTEKAPATYQAVATRLGIKEQFDVGHVAMSNHLDDNDVSSKLANQFSNLAPQSAKMNRNGGAWYEAELITECHRDVEDLLVFAGTVDDPTDTRRDYFLSTFGQTTPEYWWRLIYWTKSNKYAIWIMPNTSEATRKALLAGNFDATIEQLRQTAPVTSKVVKNLESLGAQRAEAEFVQTQPLGKMLQCRGIKTGLS